MMLNYSRGKGFTLTALRQNRSQLSPQGQDDSTVTSLQGKYLMLGRWDLGWTRTLVSQVRPGLAVDSNQWSLNLTAPRQQFVRNLKLNWKISGQDTASQVALNQPAGTTAALSSSLISSEQDGLTQEWKMEAEPFWKEHPFSVSLLRRDGRSGPGSSSSQQSIRSLMELPFLGESRLELSWERGSQQHRSFSPGGLATITNTPNGSLEILLKGNLSQRWQLRGGYRKLTGGTTTPGNTATSGEQWSLEGNTEW